MSDIENDDLEAASAALRRQLDDHRFVTTKLFYATLGTLSLTIIGVIWTIAMTLQAGVDYRYERSRELLEQFEIRFASDIEQHDMRIANNSATLRALVISDKAK